MTNNNPTSACIGQHTLNQFPHSHKKLFVFLSKKTKETPIVYTP